MEPERQNDEREIGNALKSWRESVIRQAERPEWFWTRQRARVQSRIRETQPSPPKLVWAAVAATFALAIALFAPVRQTGPPPTSAPTVEAQVQISDHDLMLAVERTLNAGVPSSLEPAGLLAYEMDQALQEQTDTQKSKEKNYEN